jgi:hypothetical protein
MRLEIEKPYTKINWVNDWLEIESFENPNDMYALQVKLILTDEQGRSLWYELNKKYAKKG